MRLSHPWTAEMIDAVAHISRVIILDARAVWIREFGRSLTKLVPTLGLLPIIDNTGLLSRAFMRVDEHDGLELISCRLQRGWWRRGPWNETSKLVRFVEDHTVQAERTLVIFCSPHYLSVCRA